MQVLFNQGTGINVDDDPRFMPPGDGDRWNVIPVSDGKDGLLVSVKGNVQLADQNFGTGDVVGAVYDVKTHGVIFFLKGSLGSAIVRYNINSEDFQLVTAAVTLIADHISARIVDRVLIWVDKEPYAINIEEAIKYNVDPGTSVYSDMDTETLRFVRYAPAFRPTVQYESDSSYSYNFLRGGQYQFVYRWEYYDHSYSVWSPISEVPVGESDEDVYGNFVTDPHINNIINVGIPEGSDIVKKVHVAVRGGNFDLFRTLTILDKSDTTFTNGWHNYRFKNDIKGDVVSDEEIFRLYDDVPREAGFVEIIDKNIVAFGKVLKGFNPVKPNAHLSYSIEEVNLPSLVHAGDVVKYVVRSGYPAEENLMLFRLPEMDYNGIRVTVGYIPSPERWGLATVWSNTFGVGDTRDDVVSYFANIPGAWPFDSETTTAGDYSEWTTITDHGLMLRFPKPGAYGTIVTWPLGRSGAYSFSQAAYVKIDTPATQQQLLDTYKVPSWKFGAQQDFALGYKDETGRLMYLLRDSSMSIEIPFLRGTPTLGARSKIHWSINHGAPAGAKYYQWYYARNTPRFIQVDMGLQEIGETSAGYVLNINGAIERQRLQGCIMPYYHFEEGDRVRIIGRGNTLASVAPVETVIDIEIKGPYTDTEDGIVSAAGQRRPRESHIKIMTGVIVPKNHYSFESFEHHFIEIYSPKRTDTNVYQEFSEAWEVEWNHESTQGTFDGGDVYARLVTPWFFGEASSFSYYYDSSSISVGKPVYHNPDQREIELQDVVHGRRYFEDTQINGLFSFHSSDRSAVMQSAHGDITGMALRGETLRVYQEKKMTSIYIGAVVIRRPDGSEELVASDRILGSIVPSNDSYGTQHPESVLQVGRSIYCFDQLNGVFLRDAVNGVFPISGRVTTNEYNFDYKMRAFFKSLEAERVHCGYDPTKELLYVHIVRDGNNETLAFHEPSNRWVSRFVGDPDYFLGAGQHFFSWRDGKMYEHGIGGTLYGETYTPIVTFYANDEAQLKKQLKSLSLHSNQAMDVMVEIPADESYTRGQKSWINKSWFVLKRGVYYSSFKNNALTTTNQEKISDLYNGEKLRGYYAKITLTGEIPLELFKVDILFNI